ncbi:unnamed protein product [Sphagnum balticum]
MVSLPPTIAKVEKYDLGERYGTGRDEGYIDEQSVFRMSGAAQATCYRYWSAPRPDENRRSKMASGNHGSECIEQAANFFFQLEPYR